MACREGLALLFPVEEGRKTHSIPEAGWCVERWPGLTISCGGGRETHSIPEGGRCAEERRSGTGLKSNNPNLTNVSNEEGGHDDQFCPKVIKIELPSQTFAHFKNFLPP